MDWKPELDAIIGARHGGRATRTLELLQALDTRHPHVGEVQQQLAWTLEAAGRLEEALPYYEKAIVLGLAPNDHANALIGLGTTLLGLGENSRAEETFRRGQVQFPDHREFDVFLALARHARGAHDEALHLVLTALADTTEDPGLTAYQRVFRHHARRLASPAAQS